MNVAFITYEYPPFQIGGAGVYARHLCEQIVNKGHSISIFVPDFIATDIEHLNNVTIVKVKTYQKLPFKALHFWINLPCTISATEIKKGNFDILHFNGLCYNFIRNISKSCQVLTIHHSVVDTLRMNKKSIISLLFNFSGEASILSLFIEKRAVNSVDHVITVSEFTKKSVMEKYQISPKKIDAIYNGMDELNSHLALKEIEILKNRFNLNDSKILLFVGRIDDKRKGLDVLLNALSYLPNKNLVTLLIVGSGEKAEAEKLAKELNIFDRIQFTGFVTEEELKIYYQLCDLYICSSRLEGFGLTLVEAMSFGKPVIATKTGAIPEIVLDNVNGFLVDVNEPEQMGEAIDNLIDDEKLSENIGIRNKHYVREKFNWAKTTEQVINIYNLNRWS